MHILQIFYMNYILYEHYFHNYNLHHRILSQI